ncbi:hypothetical protein Dsin_010726 [Dipteronia sinensis]|uniref:Uncharacterized protein n=1 Tax=Dipteronia sinensis TaxID=43782 RepID=A0AAE0ECY5_9ROSI|nr:hypothetical protein Dsin_010726 [Dipteronia sinensis]
MKYHPGHQAHFPMLKNYKKPYICDGCKEPGIGSRYRCEDCDYDLHKHYMFYKSYARHDFFPDCAFKFRKRPPGQVDRYCDGALYNHKIGKLFAQLVDLLQFYENFEIKDHVGTQLTDDKVLQSHYDRLQSFQLLAHKKVPKLQELAVANIGAIPKRADLSKKLSVLSPQELQDLVCK